jgi:glyoxylase-like metal-dependent hydrolase (beta-lactamase superfamily II)
VAGRVKPGHDEVGVGPAAVCKCRIGAAEWGMAFLTEPEPLRGAALPVLPGIRRIVARNPSVMTYLGTNTYLIEGPDGLTVLDPGPDDDAHVADILAALEGETARRILLTHTHSDHLGATAKLQAATGAAVYAYRVSAKRGFTPDRPLDDGDVVAGLTAVFTPGHAADHLSFEYQVQGTGNILFSGDHVMSWSSSIVSPPDGDMVAYYKSLELLLGRDEVLYAPGHGPLLPQPRRLVGELLAHRQMREASILAALREKEWTVSDLAEHLYHKTDFRLKMAAQRNVLAHLLKLEHEGRAVQTTDRKAAALPDDYVPDDLPPGNEKDMNRTQVNMMLQDAARRFAYSG